MKINNPEYNETFKKIENSEKAHRKLILESIEVDKTTRSLREHLKTLCTHSNTKIVNEHYEEPGKVARFDWQEKVCTACGEVVATRNELEGWAEWTE